MLNNVKAHARSISAVCATIVFLVLVLFVYFTPADAANAFVCTGKTSKLRININTADARRLELLDGVGKTIAQRIISYRRLHGNFKSLEELKKVNGIGDVKFNAIRNLIVLS
ncbi:MAG: helix-hairpin-helix domain-containing protein [Clostridia bacterium]